MQQYRKRPVVIEAVRVSAQNMTGVLDWITETGGNARITSQHERPYMGRGIEVSTLEGFMYADNGDWIIKGVAGEFYPCKDAIFQQTYEVA